MTWLARQLGRMPKPALFAAAALIQIGLIGLMVADRIRILRSGTDVLLQTRPVDPRDFLRGDYVSLAYDISTVPAGALKDQPAARDGRTVFVKLAPGSDGFYRALSVSDKPVPVSSPEVLIRGRVEGTSNCNQGTGCEDLRIDYGIGEYFVPEGEGGAIEQARNKGTVAVVAAVTPSGRAAIKRLLVDGKPVYDEPWF
jgi:uncharacterized membrane-anchored protein